MKGTTTGADILKVRLLCTSSMSLDLSKLVSATTDRVPAIIDKSKGAVALLQKRVKDLACNDEITKVHCLIHQEALCAKTTNSKSRRRRRLVRHPNSIRASTNRGQGRGFILLPPRVAALPRLDAGSGGVKPTSSCLIQNLQTSCPLGT